jgi:arylsulfatase A-like enzyme
MAINFTRGFCFLFLIAGVFAGCDSQEDNLKKRPNVLIILTDQQTNDCLSASGNPNLKTPAMDAIAKRGIYFTESYCTSPVCGPSRSSLITGRMPHETGVVWNTNSLSNRFPTIGQIFSEAGYNTAWAGKWHLPESYPQIKGVDSLFGFKVLPFKSLDKSWALGADTDGPITEAAVNFITEYADEKPFLLSVQLHNPHDICHVPRRPDSYAKASAIKDQLPALPPNFNPVMKEPEFYEQKRRMDHYGDELLLTQNYSEDDWRAYLYHYYRFAETVDGEIAKLLKTLEDKDLLTNTIIVLTSDHGDGAAAHRWAAKLSLYEEAATVPFIISWPGKIPQDRIDRQHLVSGMDLTPTLCDYAEISNAPDFTGKSLRSIIEQPDSTLRDHLVVQLADDLLDSTRHGRMVRNERFKYAVFNQGKDPEQLFDLWNDPGETMNLAYAENYQVVKSSLKGNLRRWMKETGDPYVLK